MTELETHIEKKIPFVIETKEGEEIVIFPAEKRFIKGPINAVVHNDRDFKNELDSVTADCKNFQSLRPSKNEKTN